MINNESFKRKGSYIEIWKIRANQLYDAAFTVWNSKVTENLLPNGKLDLIHHQYRPSALLMGLSLESLIKGLLIQRNNQLLNDGRLDNSIKTHDLITLFNLAGIEIENNSDKLFLKRLTANVVWMAKYAIPTKLITNYNKEYERLLVNNDSDFDSFDKYFQRILNLY